MYAGLLFAIFAVKLLITNIGMIQELKIQNFLSFKDEVVFSFEATSDTTLENYYIYEPTPGVRLLKLIMIYGKNASGKSNLLKVFDFIENLVFNTVDNKDEKIDFKAFAFDDTRDENGKLELVFYIGAVKYVYNLEINDRHICKEKLAFYPKTQPAILFNRFLDAETNTSVIEFGTKLKISSLAKEEITLKTLPNQSFFASRSQVNVSIPEIDTVYAWFKKQFSTSINAQTRLGKHSDQQIQGNPVLMKFALDFIKKADFNISDIQFDGITTAIPEDMSKKIDAFATTESVKEKLKKEKVFRTEKKSFGHSIMKNGEYKTYFLPEESQSEGTLRFYELSAPFYYAIKNNAFMPIDEIDSSLHPLLVKHFIKEFLKESQGSAQLLFTTHDMSLLNEKDVLRPDAVWFTDKGSDGVTNMYSVADIKGFRKELSYYNYYKTGKFGAIPELD